MLIFTNEHIVLSVIMLNVIMLSVIMLSFVMLNVMAPFHYTPRLIPYLSLPNYLKVLDLGILLIQEYVQ
jgi:hypothetical protein